MGPDVQRVFPPSPAALQAALRRFECRRCGGCCEGEGRVRVTAEEVDAMAAALGMDSYAFADRYARLTSSRRELELLDRPDGACIFLTAEGLCRVQGAKPKQCRDFPWTWRTPGFEQRCAGMRAALGAHCWSIPPGRLG